MLTPDDGSRDGSINGYLGDPARWRLHDSALFDILAKLVAESVHPGVRGVERSRVLPRTTFISAHLPDDKESRSRYFESVRQMAASEDVVFFDPDNGFEIKSKPRGRKDSSKYVFWEEVVRTFGAVASVLVYQHFPRVERRSFVDEIMNRVRTETGASWAASFSTSNVLFALAPQPQHEDLLEEGCRRVQERWGDQFSVEIHRAA